MEQSIHESARSDSTTRSKPDVLYRTLELARLGALDAPFSVEAQQTYLAAARATADINRVRAARLHWSQTMVFPRDEWISWVEDEMVDDASKVRSGFITAILYSAVADWPCTLQLWLKFHSFCQERAGMAGVPSADVILERAIEACGQHPTDGKVVWDIHINNLKARLEAAHNIESEDEDDEDDDDVELKAAIECLRKAYRTRLRDAVPGLDEILIDYLSFEAVDGLEGPAPINQTAVDSIGKQVADSKGAWANREQFETELAGGAATDAEAASAVWHRYVAAMKAGEKKGKGKSSNSSVSLQQLLWRAAVATNHADWWNELRRTLFESTPPMHYVAGLHAGCRRLITDPSFFIDYVCALEREGVSMIRSVMALDVPPKIHAERLISSLLEIPERGMFQLSPPTMLLRRFVDFQDQSTAKLSDLITDLPSAFASAGHYTVGLKGFEDMVAQILGGTASNSSPVTLALLWNIVSAVEHWYKVPFEDASTYTALTKVPLGCIARVFSLVKSCEIAGTASKTQDLDQLRNLFGQWGQRGADLLYSYYPSWDEARYCLQNYQALMAQFVMGQVDYAATDDQAAKYAITDPQRFVSAYQDVISATTASGAFARCRALYGRLLHRLMTAKFIENQYPTPYDYVKPSYQAWQDFEAVHGDAGSLLQCRVMARQKISEVERRQAKAFTIEPVNYDITATKRKRQERNDDMTEESESKRPRLSSVEARQAETGSAPIVANAAAAITANPDGTSGAELPINAPTEISFGRKRHAAESDRKQRPREDRDQHHPPRLDDSAPAPAAEGGGTVEDDPFEPNTVYVWNLPFSAEVSKPTLIHHFKQFGKVSDARAILGANKVCKGFGWIKFETEEGMEKAISASMTIEIGGRLVGVKQARHSQVYPAWMFRAKPPKEATMGVAAGGTAEAVPPRDRTVSAETASNIGRLDPAFASAPVPALAPDEGIDSAPTSASAVSKLHFVPRASAVRKHGAAR